MQMKYLYNWYDNFMMKYLSSSLNISTKEIFPRVTQVLLTLHDRMGTLS